MSDDPQDGPHAPIRMVVFRVPRRPAWQALYVEDGVVHVVPTGDTLAHDTESTGDCVCGPTVGLLPGHEACDHGDVWVHQHHALDGRSLPNLG